MKKSSPKVAGIKPPEGGQKQRLGFMASRFEIPEDFDRMGTEEIERTFAGEQTGSVEE
jgi:hypothetical protein